jgi:hypothetical protein
MTVRRAISGLTLGPMLIATAVFFWWFTGDIESSGLAKHDPGPRFWPTTLALCLLAAGIGTTAHAVFAYFRRARDASDGEAASEAPGGSSSPAALLRDWGVQNVALLLILLVVYLAALPRIGFALSSLLLSTALMTRLGRSGDGPKIVPAETSSDVTMPRPRTWLTTLVLSLATSAVLIAVIILLFEYLFERPLPKGDWLPLPF